MKKLCVLVVMCSLIFHASAQEQRPIHEIHVAFISSFMRYIEWPEGQTEFTIGVIGNDDVYNTLQTWYGGKMKGTKKITVKKLASTAEAQTCTLVYLDNSKSNQFDALKSAISGKPVLTITDGPKLGSKGSCINFKEVAGKLRFELNQSALDASSLKVSSQLVNIALSI